MEPSTVIVVTNLPSDEARPVKIHQRKSTCGSILKKASQIRSSIIHGGLQTNITLRVHKRICKSSPSLTLSLSHLGTAVAYKHSR